MSIKTNKSRLQPYLLINAPHPKRPSEFSATPIFYDLAKYILDYWQIPYDYNVEQSTNQKVTK